ncbi:MAG TPA: GNAT family N-acetyltransferase [Homoserinimonas sp.]|nr:GNAT family N-acetyltransferase [Homoserinimonas sp.]
MPGTPMTTPILRDVRDEDLPRVLAIYNHYVATSTVTFDEEPLSLAAFRAKVDHIQERGFPFIVAEDASGEVLGYAYASSWRPKAAYRHTAECSIYLATEAIGRGLGRILLVDLLERSRVAGIREVIAVIADEGAEASVALHRTLGFREIGHLRRVGYKFERWLGTILMQKSLADD